MSDDVSFVGRERELAGLLRLAEEAADGHGRFVLIRGEPGVGKSALAERLAAATRPRIATHWGTALEGEEQPPFWVWTQILRTVVSSVPTDELAGALGPAYQELGLLVPELIPPHSRGDRGAADAYAQFLLYDAITRALIRAGRDQPLLIVLDDLHMADRSSLRCLAFLLRQLREARLLIVGTHRDVDLDPDSPWAAAAGDLARNATGVELSGLTRAEIALLLRPVLSGGDIDSVVARVHRDSGGNPLFVRQVVRLVVAEGQVGRVPATLREVMVQRLARFPEPSRAVLRAAAVMGLSVDIPDLAMVCDLSPQEVLDALDEPVAARIIKVDPDDHRRLSFTHGLMRQVLLDDLPPGLRPRLHLRAAEALEKVQSADPSTYLARLAGHYVEAAALGDAEPAIRHSRAAAVQAGEAYAYDDALRHLANARRLLEGDPATPPARLAECLLEVADLEVRAGHSDEAIRTYQAALGHADRAGAAREYARAALGCCVGSGGYQPRPDHVVLLRSALDRLTGDDGGLRAALLAELAEVFSVFDDGYDEALQTAQEAVDTARACGDELALSRALLAKLHVVGAPNTLAERSAIVAELADSAGHRGDEEMLLYARLHEFGHALEAADRPAADTLLALVAGSADRLRTPRWRLRRLTSQITMAVLAADHDAAMAALTALLDLVDRAPSEEARMAVLHARAQMILEYARPDDADVAEQFHQLALHHGHSVWSLAALTLAVTGRPDEARHALHQGVEAIATYRNRRALLTSAVRLAEAAVRLGDRDAARSVRDVLSPYPDRLAVIGDGVGILGPVALALGRVCALLGDYDGARRALAQAEQVCQRVGAPGWRVRVLAAQAQLPGSTVSREQVRDLATRLRLSRVLLDLQAIRAFPPERALLGCRAGVWTLRHAGRTLNPKDSKGLHYLAELIRHQGVERHVLDLVTLVEADGGDARYRLGDAGPVLDARAKSAYRRRLSELRERLEDAQELGDADTAERAAREIDDIAGELARAVGLGGRDRRVGAAAEKARLNVTRAIRATIRRIGEDLPELAEHLDACVRTGAFCSYAPTGGLRVAWLTDEPDR